jgi:hypothetical protein
LQGSELAWSLSRRDPAPPQFEALPPGGAAQSGSSAGPSEKSRKDYVMILVYALAIVVLSAPLFYESLKWKFADDVALCSAALEGQRIQWAANSNAAMESRSRKLSVDDCRAVLRLPNLGQQKEKAQSAQSEKEGLSTSELCQLALGDGGNDWDRTSAFAMDVMEARRRGLTVSDCRVSIGLPSDRASQPSTVASVVCNHNSTYSNVRNAPGTKKTYVVAHLDNTSIIEVIGEAYSPVNSHKYIHIHYRTRRLSGEGYVDGDLISNTCSLLSTAIDEPYFAHNGSKLRLLAERAQRKFIYLMPRRGLIDVGVASGRVLFDGVQSDITYDGTMYAYPNGCLQIPFHVRGQASNNNRKITLFGSVPVVDKHCNVTGYRSDEFVFDYVDE